MEGIAKRETLEEKLFSWARLISATIVFIVGSIIINRFIETVVVKGGSTIRSSLAATLIIMLIILAINILRMQ
jgi:hypothetical protein